MKCTIILNKEEITTELISGITFSKTTENKPKFKNGKAIKFKKGNLGIAGSILIDTNKEHVANTINLLEGDNNINIKFMMGKLEVTLIGVNCINAGGGTATDDISSEIQFTYVCKDIKYA